MQRRFQFRSVNKQAFKNCNYFLQEISEVLFAHVLSIVNKIRAASLPNLTAPMTSQSDLLYSNESVLH